MKHLLLKLEPLIWFMFGQGIMIGTMLLTGWLLIFGVLAPAGVVSSVPLEYDRALALGSSLIGRVVLLGLIVLPLWKGAHHTRHIFIDMGGGDRDAAVAPLLYALAGFGSLLAVLAVIRL